MYKKKQKNKNKGSMCLVKLEKPKEENKLFLH